MTQPHRDFHRTAAETYKLIAAGAEENSEAIAHSYAAHLAAADKVISTFAMIADEAEKARQADADADADAFTMGQLRDARADGLQGLRNVISSNKRNTDQKISPTQSRAAMRACL